MSLEHHRYPNGLSLHVDHMPHMGSLAINMLIPYGSVHERPGEEGVAHALEHCVFLETPLFQGITDANKHAERNGMGINAATLHASTVHETRSLTLDSALVHLSQLLQQSKLPDKAIATEMKAVRREAKTALDNIDELHDTATDNALFGLPYGRDIIGYHNKLNHTADVLRGAYARHYQLGAMALVAAGNVSIDEITAKLERYFDLSKPASAEARADVPLPSPHEALITGLIRNDSDNLRLSVSYPIPPELVAKIQASQELYDIAVGVMGTKCFEEMRHKRGLSYDGDIVIADYNHPNAWALRASVTTDPDNRALAIATLDSAITKAAESYKTQRIRRALSMGVFGAITSIDAITARLEAHTQQAEWGRLPQDVSKIVGNIRNFTVEDIRTAIDDLVSITATQPRFEHRTGPKAAIGNVDKIIKQSKLI